MFCNVAPSSGGHPPSRLQSEIFVRSSTSAVTVVTKRFRLCSPESGNMHTSLMLVSGWMEENTLPCGAQRDQSESAEQSSVC